MTIVHNAYGFDYARFERLLERALVEAAEGDSVALSAFALHPLRRLTNPDTKRPLDGDELLRAVREDDATFIAEACMTAFYDVDRNAGVGLEFAALDRALDRIGCGDLLFGSTYRASATLANMGMATSCLFDRDELEGLRARLDPLGRLVAPSTSAKLARCIDAGRAAGGLYVSLDFVELASHESTEGAAAPGALA